MKHLSLLKRPYYSRIYIYQGRSQSLDIVWLHETFLIGLWSSEIDVHVLCSRDDIIV